MPEPRDDVTRLLSALAAGDQAAVSPLFAIVYDELRRVAAAALRRERPDHTLQPTALVHEAYLRLASEPDERWQSREHFLAVAARAMRRVLVDHARGHNAQKRGRGEPVLSLEDIDAAAPGVVREIDFLALDIALTRLASFDPRQAQLVELRFFGGLTVEEAARVAGVSPRTVKREWQVARAWLRREMSRIAGEGA